MEFYLKLSILGLLIQFTTGHIIIVKGNQSIDDYYDLPAQFGPPIPSSGLHLYAVEAFPKNGCSILQIPPNDPDTEDYKYVAVIARLDCSFEDKVRNAQAAKYDAVIVYNIGSDDLEQMSAKNGADIKIPSVFVGESTGTYICKGYNYKNGFSIIINDELPFNINTHLIIPFSILVGLCFIIMIVYMIFKCAREQRRLRQHRLPKRLLKKIPTMKFTKGLPYETCVICLDEYAEGDKIRVLPCQHAYHCGCIDIWLTKNRRVCPICKRKVFPKGESSRRSRRRHASSDSMSDSETDDTTPLLNQNENNTNTTNHGTFNNQNQNTTRNTSSNHSGRNDNDNGQTSDEENVLAVNDTSNNRQTGRRTNPFDRAPNNDENIIQSINTTTRSIFNIFSIFRLFRRNRPQNVTNSFENQIDVAAEIENAIASLDSSLQQSLQSSSNVLNTNLNNASITNQNNNYGGGDDDDDGYYETEYRSIYEPINTSNITSQQNQNTGINSDSAFIQTPTRGGLSVAALPNTSFINSNNNNNNNNNNIAISSSGSRRGGTRKNRPPFIV